MPNPKPDGWSYRRIDPARLRLLEREISFDSLFKDILAGVAIKRLTHDPCDEAERVKLKYNRVGIELEFRNSRAADAADQLLNGAYGLRAQYCLSPELGDSVNAGFCLALDDAIHSRSIAAGCGVNSDEMRRLPDALGDSLRRPSAKVWFDSGIDRREPAAEDGELSSAIWAGSAANPANVATILRCMTQAQIELSLAKGRSVPRPLGLEVKAAFVASNREEYVPMRKKTRALQIHLLGWT